MTDKVLSNFNPNNVKYYKKYRDTHRDKMKEYQKAYHNANRETLNDKNNQYITNINNISRKTAFNHYSQWTPEEDTLLINLKKQNKTHKDIAKFLGRSISSVNTRLVRLRKSDPFTGNPHNDI